MIDLIEILILVIIGLFAGLTGGMLGVGGSIVMIPAMTELLGPDQHLYQSAAMMVNFFVVIPAVYQHHRAKVIERSTVLRIIPLAIMTVLLGVGISELSLFAGTGEAYLRGAFGLFLFFAGGFDLYRLTHGRDARADLPGCKKSPPVVIGWGRSAAIAAPVGLIAGLLGIGGGLLAVPLQRRFLGIPIRTAIANSATIIIATSLVGAAVKNYAYVTEHANSTKPFMLAAVLIPTSILGSLLGSRLTHRLPVKVIKMAFCALLILAAVRLSFGAVASLMATS
ncbi:MAG: sulfite exporter TauE/SafE family protein [Phycisphaerales bacterium]|nr:MAG: sulfite exporter TauE/SafE family protein [Phycisphaerales bacterium]